jgi:hypothetical protein
VGFFSPRSYFSRGEFSFWHLYFDWKLFGTGPTCQRLLLPHMPARRRMLGMLMPCVDAPNDVAHLYRCSCSDRASPMPPPCLHGQRHHATPSPWSSLVSSEHCYYGRSAPLPLTARFSRAQVPAERHRTRPLGLR